MEQNKLGRKNKKVSMVQEKNEELERRRMKRLAAKHLDMLGYFVRYVDYVVIETLVSIVR